ncbi:DUF6404 family protein [Undibacterium sp.]|jgi:hypothetical protein|uniref:DUF6404 family protein n=1 Tax=Undibacterium sp. TaxID=1914977 RepID=UPI002BE6B622|nr:DUF6404 family protein [Undibacterium sp.]HTD03430.1 DUF6404 family protein [Undibacterium sp.]
MNPETKRTAALKLLAETGMWRSNYAPPIFRLAWKLGFNLPPPHFNGFWRNVLALGIPFGVFWGIWMWISVWSNQRTPPSLALLSVAAAAILFGLSMAAQYAYGRHKHGLPLWREFNPL